MPPASPRILLLEDDPAIARTVVYALERDGATVTHVLLLADATRLLSTPQHDLLLLDVGLPDGNGLDFCRTLRQNGDARLRALPVLMLTARGEEIDRVLGLEMGADDYLTKPFATRELLARIRSVLRRTRMLPPNLRPVQQARWLAFGDWLLDTTARHLVDDQGTLVLLTGGEYRLLRVLMEHAQRVLTRDQLLNLTQGRDADPFDRSIDLLISRLRQRLRDGSREPRYIKTVRSEGYVFCAEVRDHAGGAP